ncbi:hypothetical protein [Pseudoalteromonas sp. H105]|uniref:PglD-related sugar-binding protein n=1 Tax=Pseudoalteromonas sp. H105 TaxID=1348393 RepID=UPI000ADF86D1|nr:hypothetical protein [Pseudoalteromonas sp. H105]
MKFSQQKTLKELQGGVYLIGAGSYSRVLADFLHEEGINVLGLFDDLAQPSDKNVAMLLGYTKDIINTVPKGASFIVCIGNGEVRKDYFQLLSDAGYYTPTFVSKSAYVSPNVKLGSGVVILARSVVLNSAEIGDGCILNVSSLVDHDVVVGDFSHINVQSCVSNYARVPHFYQSIPGEIISE